MKCDSVQNDNCVAGKAEIRECKKEAKVCVKLASIGQYVGYGQST